jgi:Nucleotidyl transferase AbiEii toxin, Type IV TA system
VTAADRYATPSAFRRALTDQLKAEAGTSRWTLPQLQRHVAYDRLLERLYQFDRNWVVKGATALMARELGTRGTLDIDLYREISLASAEADFRHAAAADIADWFQFNVGASARVGTVGVRLPVTSVIGTTTWASFHVDLIGAGLRMTGQPEHVPPLAENAIPEVSQHGYQAYPLVDHVADKIAAT